MKPRTFIVPLGLSALALGVASSEPVRPKGNVEPKTAEAVQAADSAWGAAEASGDSAFVNWLLLPDYQSVGDQGKATEKATILAHVTSPRSADRASKAAAWKAAHPQRPVVRLFGNTAVLTWTSTKPGATINSCDVFVYVDGHWRAIYSQHTSAGV